ncbi:MAG: ABC transporter permease [Firmicutes bacterium]|nr:ABC transporter permease [Bacillota bacterium]
MKSLKIALSNIRKRKSSAITLTIMALIATIMLTISLSLLTGVGSLFDTRAYELNTAHIAFSIDARGWSDEVYQQITSAENLTEYKIQEAFIGEVRYILNDRSVRAPFIFTLEPQNPNLNTVEVLDRLSTTPQNPIILPLMFRFNGFNAGDNFTLTSVGTTHGFTIYGFYESIFFGSPTVGLFMGFVSEETFSALNEDNNLFPTYTVSLKFETMIDAENYFWNELIPNFLDGGLLLSSTTLLNIRLNSTSFSLIMAIIMSLVAIITVIIALIVARFNIINSIEQDIQTLGALKSIGFTGGQIIKAILLQFLLIITVGIILGIIITIPLMGIVGTMVSSTSGLLWANMGMILPSIIAVVAVLGTIMLVSFLIVRKAKKITPINALRNGLENQIYKKSITNLESSVMPLNISMAGKQFKTNFKRNITAFLTLTLFGFMTVLGFTMHHNFVTDTSAYRDMVGFEPAHIRIVAFNNEFAIENFETISSKENVRATLAFEMFSLSMSTGEQFGINVWEDIRLREVNTIIRGRHPVAYNEISIMAQTSDWLGISIGDTITLEHSNGKTADFRVTGIFQGWGAMGNITLDGLSRLQDEVVLRNMYIYLYDYSDQAIANFMNSLVTEFGRELIIINYIESFNEFLAQLQGPIEIGMTFIIIITIAVIVLVLFLMVNTIINRGKKEAGILKAIGFTSGHLILQLLLSFLPIILGGVMLGTLLGIFTTNPLLGLMFSGLGIARATFIIVPWLVAIGAVLLICTSIITLLLVSIKYRKITARSLIAS